MEFNGYEIKRLDFSDPTDMQKLVDLQNAVYAGKHTFTAEGFNFWYINNPEGKVISFNAFYGNIIAAHYALIPYSMKIDGNVEKGLLSMATVTHPEHRGKKLFKTLAQLTYDYAREQGYKFVIGVANANSYPGFVKYFNFTDVGRLEVRIGLCGKISGKGEKLFQRNWTTESLAWRLSRENYYRCSNTVYGTIGAMGLKRFPLVKTLLGTFEKGSLDSLSLRNGKGLLRPLSLYVGLGSNAKQKGYIKIPDFIKHSPFHLIFLDLTGGTLPIMTKDNVFFQLADFDVN